MKNQNTSTNSIEIIESKIIVIRIKALLLLNINSSNISSSIIRKIENIMPKIITIVMVVVVVDSLKKSNLHS